MPVKFNMSTEGRRADLDPIVPVTGNISDDSDAMYAEGYNTTKEISDSIAALQEDNSTAALDAYAVEAGDIVGQTANYASERERILQGLSTATDKQAVEKYYKELSRLRNGELQGALSPLRAATLINNLTKNAINRNPGLALKFRQLHNGMLSDIPSVSGFSGKEVDPDLEAMQNLVKESVETGITVPALIAGKQQEFVAARQKAALDAKMALGQASVVDVSSALQAELGSFYGKLAAQMGNAASNPSFQGMSWFAELQVAQSKITQTVNESINTAQLEGKMIISKDEREAILKEALAPLQPFLQIAEKLDNPKLRASAALAMKQIAETGDYMSIRKRIGPMATLMGNDLMSYLDDFSKNVQMIQRGQRAQLDALAAAGDFKTKMILAAIDGKDFESFMAEAVVATSKGEALPESGIPVMDKMSYQASLDYAINARTPMDKKATAFKSLMSQVHAFDALEKRREVLNQVKLFPEAVRALRTNSTKLLVEKARDGQSIKGIKFDAAAANPFSVSSATNIRGEDKSLYEFDPFTGERKQVRKSSSVLPAAGLYGENVEYTPGSTQDLVNRLNQHYRVFSNFIGVEGGFKSKAELQKWAGTTWLDLGASTDADFLQKKQPTAPAPDTQTVSDPLEAEAVQVGMTRKEYEEWINRPAQ